MLLRQLKPFYPMPHQNYARTLRARRLGRTLPYEPIAINEHPIAGPESGAVSSIVPNLRNNSARSVDVINTSGNMIGELGRNIGDGDVCAKRTRDRGVRPHTGQRHNALADMPPGNIGADRSDESRSLVSGNARKWRRKPRKQIA
jgi:hypothetical protein